MTSKSQILSAIITPVSTNVDTESGWQSTNVQNIGHRAVPYPQQNKHHHTQPATTSHVLHIQTPDTTNTKITQTGSTHTSEQG